MSRAVHPRSVLRRAGGEGRGGSLVLAAIAAVVAGATATPTQVGSLERSADTATVVSDTVPVVAAARPVVCPGSESAVRATGEQDAPAGVPVALAAANPGTGPVPADELELVADVGGALVTVPPPGSTARQTSLATDGDLRGAASATCSPTAREHWLVGGSSAPGRRTRLVLSNPAPAPTTVDVDVLGPQGPIDSTLGRGLVVPAGTRLALPLDAVAPEADRLAVRVRADGPGVSAVLWDSWLRGTVPGGVDDVVATSPPGTTQAVPGLLVADADAVTGETAASVRIAVPGDRPAQVRVDLAGPNGPGEPAGGTDLSIPAGAVADVSLAGLAAGPWTALVTSDVDVVAAGLVVAGGRGRGPSELAWLPAVGAPVPEAPEPVSLPVAAPPIPGGWSLLLGAPAGSGTVELTGHDAEGEITGTRALEVASGRSVLVSTTDGGLGDAVASVTVERSTGQVVVAALAAGPTDDGPLLTAAGIGSGPVGRAALAVRAGRPPQSSPES